MTDELVGGGAELVDSTPDSGGGAVDSGSAAPSPISLKDDTLISHPGVNGGKPIAYTDAVKGFQRQFTQASQKAAELERRLAEREQRLAAIERQQQQTQQTGTNSGVEQALQTLEQLPYVSGAQQKQLVVGVATALKQRDQLIGSLIQEVRNLKQTVGTLNNSHVSTNFDSKIANWLKEGNYPAEAAELAKEIYLAYEGDDLDNEFPTIFANRWKQIQQIVEGARRAQLTAAKKLPWVPGKGGQTGPSAPMKLKGNEKPKDIADQIWEAMNAEALT